MSDSTIRKNNSKKESETNAIVIKIFPYRDDKGKFQVRRLMTIVCKDSSDKELVDSLKEDAQKILKSFAAIEKSQKRNQYDWKLPIPKLDEKTKRLLEEKMNQIKKFLYR